MDEFERLVALDIVLKNVQGATKIFSDYVLKVNRNILKRDLKYEAEFNLYLDGMDEILKHLKGLTVNE